MNLSGFQSATTSVVFISDMIWSKNNLIFVVQILLSYILFTNKLQIVKNGNEDGLKVYFPLPNLFSKLMYASLWFSCVFFFSLFFELMFLSFYFSLKKFLFTFSSTPSPSLFNSFVPRAHMKLR